MAKKERAQNESETNLEINEDLAPTQEEQAEPSLEGLVKMAKDGKHIHAHPDVVKHHEGNGWKRA